MSLPRAFRTEAQDAGQRLDVVLARHLAESRSQAAARIERGEVSVGGEVAKRARRVEAGEKIEVLVPPQVEEGGAGVPVPPVRYEDHDLLVVAKPAGLVVHPGAGHAAGTLVQVLADAGYPLAPAGGRIRPGIVHRLDRDTSGLLVVAKTDAALHGLGAALRERAVERRYLALVVGEPGAPTGRVEAPIGRDPRGRKRFAVVAGGKPAITHWVVASTGATEAGTVALLECRLETGRTHQIRVHLAYAGFPVVGDRVYGRDQVVAAALGLDRPFLHAYRLAFRHPVTAAPVEVAEPLPPHLAAVALRCGCVLPRM